MNKEEILEKSRKEKNDEGFDFFLKNAYKRGTATFMIVIVPLFIIATIFGRLNDCYLLLTVFWGYFAGYSCKGLDYKNNKFTIFLTTCLTIMCFVMYIKGIL